MLEHMFPEQGEERVVNC